jgi:hypothetical protein
MYLGDSFGLYSIDHIHHPVFTVPILQPGSPREPPDSQRRSTPQTGSVSRPRFFVVEDCF